MATTNSRDVALVIKARDEATQAIESVTNSLNKLFAGQQNVAGSSKATGVSLGEMAKMMAGVDKAVATISGAADKAEKSFDSLSASLARRKQDLAAYQRQAEEAAKAINLLNGANAVVSSGRDQSGRISQVRELQATYDSLQKKIAAVGKTIADEDARLQGSRSSLQQLGSTAIAAAQQQETLTKAYNNRREAVAALANEEARRAAAEANVAALNARISPALAGQRATDNGATTSALAAREEARYIKEAAIAHELFENRVKAGVRALQAEQAAARGDAEAFAALQRELNPLTALEEKYAQKIALVNKARAAGKITGDQQIEMERRLAAEKKRATADLDKNGNTGVTLFGLRPYELTNLSYQVNDVVTQIASGTSLSQTLAQQGGQILQLFPKVGSSIAAAFSNPYFLAAAAVFAAVAYAIKQTADEADRLRTISANLDLNAAGKNYQASALLDSVHAMRALGASAEDAMKSVKTFTDEGLRAERIDQFGMAAINMSRVLGQEIPESAKQMAAAFTGGYESVVKLDQATNFLSAAQREHVRVLFEEGKAEEARAYALDIFTGKMDAVADKQRGTWEKSTRSLGAAWDSLKTSMGDTVPIQAAFSVLEGLADLLDRIANVSDGRRTFADLKRDMADAASQLAEMEKSQKTAAPIMMPWITRRIAELKATIAALVVEEQRMKVSGGVTTESDPNSQAAKARKDKLRELSIEEELQALRLKGDKGLTEQEKLRREQLAGLQAIRGVEDSAVATAKRKIAVEKEHAAILKEQERIAKSAESAAKTAASERERAITQFSSRVVGAEGGAAKNPNSSAVGFGQFIDSTWLDQFRKVFADQSKSMSNDQILALRSNSTVAKAIIDNYARENAKFLEKFGQKVTAGNLYLAHFLGAGDALKVLQAKGDTPVDQLLGKKVMAANKGYLTTKGRARTADELETFIAGRVGDTGQAQSAGQAEIEKLRQDQIDDQEKFNRSVEKGNDERQRSIDAMRQQSMLQDSTLIAAQKEVAVAKAEFDLKQRVADLNASRKDGQSEIVLTQAQIDKTRELAAAEFDLAHARETAQAKTAEIQRPIEQLTAERDALQARIEYLNQNGLYDQAKSLVPDLTATNSQLREAIDAAIEFYEALDLSNDSLHRTPEQIRAIVEGLRTAKDESQQWVTIMGVGGKTIAQTFANSAVNAIDSFLQAVTSGKNAFASLWSAFRAFAADFLLQIAKMIQQQIIFNLVSTILKGVGGAAGGVGGGGNFGASNPFVPTTIAHTGGVIGSTVLQTRAAAPQWFMNATRYHGGGIPGLAPDEVPIIAKNTEEIITAADPRHRFNGGASGGAAPQDIKIVNAFDAADMLSKALETKAGQRVLLNWVGANSRAFAAASGGN